MAAKVAGTDFHVHLQLPTSASLLDFMRENFELVALQDFFRTCVKIPHTWNKQFRPLDESDGILAPSESKAFTSSSKFESSCHTIFRLADAAAQLPFHLLLNSQYRNNYSLWFLGAIWQHSFVRTHLETSWARQLQFEGFQKISITSADGPVYTLYSRDPCKTLQSQLEKVTCVRYTHLPIFWIYIQSSKELKYWKICLSSIGTTYQAKYRLCRSLKWRE